METRNLIVLVAVAVSSAACGSDSGGLAKSAISKGVGVPATVTNLVTSPSAMEEGDVYQVLFGQGSTGEISFDGVDASSTFVLAVVNMAVSGASSTVQVVGNAAATASVSKSASIAEADDAVGGVGELFHEQLREWERGISYAPPTNALSAMLAKAEFDTPTYVIGQRDEFRALKSVTSNTQYQTVTAEVRCVEERVVWYLDVEVMENTPEAMTDADIATSCAQFNTVIEKADGLIGSTSDMNGDGKLTVLQTAAVNRQGALGGGIITGYFLATDLYPRGANNAVSNAQEMIYIMTPDPTGQYGLSVSRELALENLIPAVLPHELQHAINFNEHVLERGATPEENWLNEGLAHLFEDVLGYGQENPSRYDLYLQSPASNRIVTPWSPNLSERGGIFLFLRYLYEQHGDPEAFLRALVQTESRGVDNVEAAFASADATFDQFGEFLMRWTVAVALNDTGLTADPRYTFAGRQWDHRNDVHSGVCTVCNADDGRGTQLTGIDFATYGVHNALTLYPASAKFFLISGQHQKITLAANNSDNMGAILMRVD
jgi:hypothetical protein